MEALTIDHIEDADVAETLELIGPEAKAQAMTVISDRPRALLPAPIERLREVAEVLAYGMNVPVGFQGNPRKCLSIAYQAALWKMDPVAVASKCYLVPVKGGGERLAYEAQLVAALINQNAPLVGPMRISYSGNGVQRFCVVEGTRRGGEVISVSSPILAQITVKNSPLWITDPDQQLAYYTQRSFARRYFPEVLLGVYSVDEMRAMTVTDITPRRDPFDDDAPLPEVEGELVEDAKSAPEPSGGHDAAKMEPQDLEAARAWAAETQAAIFAMQGDTPDALVEPKLAQAMRDAATSMIKDKRFGRLKAYDQPVANAINSSFIGRFKSLPKSPE